MTISDEAVEAAAKASWERSNSDPWKSGDTNDERWDDRQFFLDDAKVMLEAAAPFIRAESLREFADESQERSDTFMKTMQHMADSREYSADDVLRYGAFAAEANTTAYKLRVRAATERGRAMTPNP